MKNQIVVNKFFVDKKGKRYLPIEKSGIPPLFILMDGIVKTQFEGERQIYIAIEEILRWFKEEEKMSGEKNKEIIKRNIIFMENLNKKRTRKMKLENKEESQNA